MMTSISKNNTTFKVFKFTITFFLIFLGLTIISSFILGLLGFHENILNFFGLFVSIPSTYIIYKKYSENKEDKLIDFSLKQINIMSLLLSVVSVFLMFLWVFLISSIVPKTDSSETTKMLSNMGILGIIGAVFIAPVTEEIVFRGILFKVMNNNKYYFLISGLVFGLMHLQFTGRPLIDIVPVLVTFGIGAISAINYEKTNNIYIPILSHALYNSIVMFISMNVK